MTEQSEVFVFVIQVVAHSLNIRKPYYVFWNDFHSPEKLANKLILAIFDYTYSNFIYEQ